MTNHQHDIEKYLKGELTPAERYALEKKALSDPFLADALEGAESLHNEVFSKDVTELNKKISEQKGATFWTWSLRIAAGVAIVVASTYIMWRSFETQPENKQLALEKNESESPKPILKDSSTTSGELSLTTTEQPTAGPAGRDQAATSKSTRPVTIESKPRPTATTEPVVEPIAEADLAEEIKIEEIKTTEPMAQTKPVEKEALDEAVKYKSADVQRAKKRSLAKDDQRKEAAPTMTDSRSAGASYVTSNVIKGKVTSTEDGSALPGVNVIIKGSTIGTVTDEMGNYEIEVGYSNPVLTYSFIGLRAKELSVGDKKEMDVDLALDATQLSEVVVTAMGIQKETKALGYSVTESQEKATFDLAHPSNGYRSFKQYLQQNIHYPEIARSNKVEGRVTVEFTVETSGELTNYRIIRGIGSGCDEELIRLIKEGPQWIPTKKDNVPVQDKARVRLKFELP